MLPSRKKCLRTSQSLSTNLLACRGNNNINKKPYNERLLRAILKRHFDAKFHLPTQLITVMEKNITTNNYTPTCFFEQLYCVK